MSVIVDEGAFWDMAGREADPDEEGSNNEWLANAKKGIRFCSQHDALVCVVAQDDLKKNIWYTSGAEAMRMSRCS